MATSTSGSTVTFEHFLQRVPPGVLCNISDLATGLEHDNTGTPFARLANPEITLHCETAVKCVGNRVFQTSTRLSLYRMRSQSVFMNYVCRNCSEARKTFAILLQANDDLESGSAFKYGEIPPFGPPIPSRLSSLIGPQREMFLKGRRAENQGMGIAAFAYYRRVIEDQKNRIFDEIIKVCNRLSADQSIVDQLSRAKSETQFSKGVDDVRIAIPQALFISGRNPLTLLHTALSEGLHAQTDEECLEIATSIRVVMAEFAERMGEVLKEEAELTKAVSRLLQRKPSAPKSALELGVPDPPTQKS